jgi:hypothetical protein
MYRVVRIKRGKKKKNTFLKNTLKTLSCRAYPGSNVPLVAEFYDRPVESPGTVVGLPKHRITWV